MRERSASFNEDDEVARMKIGEDAHGEGAQKMSDKANVKMKMKGAGTCGADDGEETLKA